MELEQIGCPNHINDFVYNSSLFLFFGIHIQLLYNSDILGYIYCDVYVWRDNCRFRKSHIFEPIFICYARVMFLRYLKKAGISEKGYSLHALRHTCATELLNAGMRLECLQQLLGHSNVSSPAICPVDG